MDSTSSSSSSSSAAAAAAAAAIATEAKKSRKAPANKRKAVADPATTAATQDEPSVKKPAVASDGNPVTEKRRSTFDVRDVLSYTNPNTYWRYQDARRQTIRKNQAQINKTIDPTMPPEIAQKKQETNARMQANINKYMEELKVMESRRRENHESLNDILRMADVVNNAKDPNKPWVKSMEKILNTVFAAKLEQDE